MTLVMMLDICVRAPVNPLSLDPVKEDSAFFPDRRHRSMLTCDGAEHRDAARGSKQ